MARTRDPAGCIACQVFQCNTMTHDVIDRSTNFRRCGYESMIATPASEMMSGSSALPVDHVQERSEKKGKSFVHLCSWSAKLRVSVAVFVFRLLPLLHHAIICASRKKSSRHASRTCQVDVDVSGLAHLRKENRTSLIMHDSWSQMSKGCEYIVVPHIKVQPCTRRQNDWHYKIADRPTCCNYPVHKC